MEETLIGSIVEKATSDVTLVFALLSIVIIIAGKPLYKMLNDYRTSRQASLIQRENNLLEVIKGNSTIMAELKTLLTATNTNCKDCKETQIEYFKNYEKGVNAVNLNINNIEHSIKAVEEKIDLQKKACSTIVEKLESALKIHEEIVMTVKGGKISES